MVEGEGNDQLWGSGRGAIVMCYGGGREGFGGVDVVPLQGANFCFISSSYIQGHQFHADAQENNNEFCLELLADATLFSTLTTQKMFFAIWGLCWYFFFLDSKKKNTGKVHTKTAHRHLPCDLRFKPTQQKISTWKKKTARWVDGKKNTKKNNLIFLDRQTPQLIWLENFWGLWWFKCYHQNQHNFQNHNLCI